MINFEDLNSRLKNEWNYAGYQLEGTIARLKKMSLELQSAFEHFLLEDEFLKEPAFFGLTPLDISQAYPFKPPAVFLCLDWIRREPQKALDALVEEYHKPLPKSFNAKEYQEFIATQKIKTT